MELKPIRTKAEYAAALKKISSLLEEYEEEHHPIGPPDPIEAVKFRKEQMGRQRP
jgi:HTH-type transcriptional regulator/antitoxin HigA